MFILSPAHSPSPPIHASRTGGSSSRTTTAEIVEAKALKQLNPNLKVGVTRNSVVLTTFWDSAKAKMEDPAYNHFWLQCDTFANAL